MRARVLLAASFAILVAASASGCITVYPGRGAVTTDPRAGALQYQLVPVYEAQADPKGAVECVSGSDVRTIFVPQLSKTVLIDANAHLTSIMDPTGLDSRHFDLTVEDGDGLVWLDVHLHNNDTLKKIAVEGPRPGGWTVTFNYQICNVELANINDNFHILIVVKQPA